MATKAKESVNLIPGIHAYDQIEVLGVHNLKNFLPLYQVQNSCQGFGRSRR